MTTLKDQTALVTGAGSGLGAAIARALVEAGMKVVVADISREKADKVAHAAGRAPHWRAYIAEEKRRLAEEPSLRASALNSLLNMGSAKKQAQLIRKWV